MEVVKTYIAFDGTEFDEEEDCVDYEKSMSDASEACWFFNGKRELIKNPTGEEMTSYAMFIIVKNAEKAKELFRWLCEMYGMETPRTIYDGAVLHWDDDDVWVDLQREADGILRDIAELKQKVGDIR